MHGQKIDPLKAFETLCVLREGYEVFEEVKKDQKFGGNFFERRKGLKKVEVTRRRLDYVTEKQRAIE